MRENKEGTAKVYRRESREPLQIADARQIAHADIVEYSPESTDWKHYQLIERTNGLVTVLERSLYERRICVQVYTPSNTRIDHQNSVNSRGSSPTSYRRLIVWHEAGTPEFDEVDGKIVDALKRHNLNTEFQLH